MACRCAKHRFLHQSDLRLPRALLTRDAITWPRIGFNPLPSSLRSRSSAVNWCPELEGGPASPIPATDHQKCPFGDILQDRIRWPRGPPTAPSLLLGLGGSTPDLWVVSTPATEPAGIQAASLEV